MADGCCLHLSQVGTVRAILHREISGRLKTVTVSGAVIGKRLASVLVVMDRDWDDLGLTHLAVTSGGGMIGGSQC